MFPNIPLKAGEVVIAAFPVRDKIFIVTNLGTTIEVFFDFIVDMWLVRR